MENRAAFFDLDGTLYREGLIAEIFKKLVKYEIIKSEKWYNEVKPEYNKWDKRQGNYDNYLLKMAGIYIQAIKGLHRTQVEFIAKKVVEQKGDRVYTYTRDMIKWHKEQGDLIITISGSPMELVREMATKYGFDDYSGAVYLTDENEIYTGVVTPMWDSVSKRKALLDFKEKYSINLEQSYAYGDTGGDYSMFQLVKHPVCVNPTRELLNKILEDAQLRERTKIVVERKDVIYTLSADCTHIF